MKRTKKAAAAIVIGTAAAVLGAMTASQARVPATFVATADTVTPAAVTEEGGSALFANLDADSHTVTARAKDAAGRPLFDSAIVRFGEIATVAGIQDVTAGIYDYYCVFHPWMSGTLVVSSAPPIQP